MLLAAGCDHGLAPPEEPSYGTLHVFITYAGGAQDWPSPDSLRDLRFVAMRFVPRDTSDLLDLNRIVFSERLRSHVARDTVVLARVESGAYLYVGVAQKYGADLFAWRPVGLYEADNGVLFVAPRETTRVEVAVDFRHPPIFPPP